MVLDVLELVDGEIEVLQDDKKLTGKGSVQKVSLCAYLYPFYPPHREGQCAQGESMIFPF